MKTTCSFCGQENDETARFCSDCGKALTKSAARMAPPVGVGSGTSAQSASTMPGSGEGTQKTATPGPKCRKCGHTTDPRFPYCASCGTRVVMQAQESTCRHCSAPYVKGVDLFCSRCGTRVGERVSVVRPLTAVIDGMERASGPQIAILDERGEPASVFELDRGEAIIGRGDADIRFAFDVFLSPLHARIDLNEGSLWRGIL